MRSNAIFYFTLLINAITLLVSLSGVSAMSATHDAGACDGLTDAGRTASWAIPVMLMALMALAFWLRTRGKMLAANLLLLVPALPMLVGLVLWGGLAVLFGI
ncbi:MAG TPA: hypothetical protein VK168_16585 [Saprospiraceae bacterium]|nr:hypothetical protein [Saprospiraceae bacterium]